MKSARHIVAALFLAVCLSITAAYAQHSRIVFDTQPVLTAQVGMLYSYDANARSSDTAELITYSLRLAPTGMTIDSLSGVVTWTPSSTGYATVDLVARGSMGNSRHQYFVIHVSGPLGRIAGRVIDAETQAPIAGVTVQLFASRMGITTSWGDGPISILSGVTDSAGMYSIADIDTGRYYAEAFRSWRVTMVPMQVDEYIPVWWRNSPTMSGADPIQVVPDSTLTIDFQMMKRVPPTVVSVSGVVTDSNGSPIRNAFVAISNIRPNSGPEGGDDGGVEDGGHSSTEYPHWGEIEDATGSAHTDSSGTYSVHVVAGRTYIAAAYARGYVTQFYKNKTNVLEADQFVPLNDTTGFDFTLSTIPAATGTISGSVQDSAGQRVVSRLILFSVRRTYDLGVRTINSDSLGNFEFQNLYDGKYLLMAVPYHDYLPAFYAADSFGVWRWRDADTITLSGSVSGLIVGVIKGRTGGAGTARGRVHMDSGTPIAGAVVYASLVTGGQPIGFAVTVSDGSYTLGGLLPDQYTLVADKPEYVARNSPSVSIDYALGGSATAPDVTFQSVNGIDPGNGTGGTLPTSVALYQNYPNPFNPATRIQYDLSGDAHVLLKVFNIIGQQVAILINGNQKAGSHSIEFDGTQFPSGVYFYRLQVENSVMTRKMIIMK